MRYTIEQYDTAIASLELGKLQLEPDGQNCAICGDSGHQAFECGWNPLVAVAICNSIAKTARDQLELWEKDPADRSIAMDYLNNLLFYFSGQQTHMGEVVGPAKIKSL